MTEPGLTISVSVGVTISPKQFESLRLDMGVQGFGVQDKGEIEAALLTTFRRVLAELDGAKQEALGDLFGAPRELAKVAPSPKLAVAPAAPPKRPDGKGPSLS